MIDVPRKADKAKRGCKTHEERQTRPGKIVRHIVLGRKGHEGMFLTLRKADKTMKRC